MHTSSHIRRIALTAVIGCASLGAWTSAADAVPIGLHDTAPIAPTVKSHDRGGVRTGDCVVRDRQGRAVPRITLQWLMRG